MEAEARVGAAEEMGILVDQSDRVIGSAPRSEIRARNLLHRGAGVLVRNPAGELFVHRRTETKDVYPGMHDVVAGGMASPGESYATVACRELEEELGISGVRPEFHFLHRYRDDSNDLWMALYEVTWSGPVRLQEEEIAWGDWMPVDDVFGKLDEWAFTPDHRSAFDRWLARGSA